MLWPTKKLGEILNYEQPTKYIVRSTNYKKFGSIPVLTAGKSFILGYTDEKNGIFPKDKLPVIIFDDFTTALKFVDFPFKVKSSAMKILHPKKDLVDAKYVFYKMQTIDFPVTQHKRYWISKYSQIKIPLPPLSEQKRIVEKIEKLFAKIHEAERLRAESLAASAALLPSALHKVFSSAKKENWPNKKLGEVCDFQGGTQPPKSVFKYEPQKGYVRLLQIRDFVSDAKATYIPDSPKLRKCAIDDILIGRYGASVGKILKGKSGAYNVAIIKAIPNENFLLKDYLYLFLQSPDIQKGFTNFSKRAAQAGFTKEELGSFEISLPPLSEQKKIVAYLDAVSQKFQELQKLQQQTAADFSALRQSILAEFFNQK